VAVYDRSDDTAIDYACKMEIRSVTDIHEAELCRWLFSDPTVSAPLCRELELAPPSLAAFSVPTARIVPNAEGPGDIDVLVSTSPHHKNALAIEVKRVKIDADTFHTGMPGKLQDLRRGVQQASLLGRLQFSRAMLLVVVVTDGRERHRLNFAFRGPEVPMLRKAIEEFPDRKRLAANVGLAFIELTQPVDKAIADAGSHWYLGGPPTRDGSATRGYYCGRESVL
jgi:hypothetical protein